MVKSYARRLHTSQSVGRQWPCDIQRRVKVIAKKRKNGREPSSRDKAFSSFFCVRCTARTADRRTDGNLASGISLARHLSLSVVLLVAGSQPGRDH